MDALRRLAVLLALSLSSSILQAQGELLPAVPVSGTLASGETQTWTFTASGGAMLSLILESQDTDFDPALSLNNSAGTTLFSSDDYDYPATTDALLEGITIPSTGSYTVSVSGYGGSSGPYELTLLPGFARLAAHDTFTNETAWDFESDTGQAIIENNRLALIASTPQSQNRATYTGDSWDDYYVQIEVPEITGPPGWQIGLLVHQRGNEYYRYSLNDQGQWRFLVRTSAGDRVIRDWSGHPAIVARQTPFSLGILANSSTFEFFYNGQLIGRIDDSTLESSGQIGLLLETPATLSGDIIAQFQNLIVTTPHGAVIPQQIATGNSTVMPQELMRRRLTPSGQLSLVVPESFVTFNRPGVNELLLGSGQTFRTFAIGTTLTWEIATPDMTAGCGLILRAADRQQYLLAYLDQTGGYGLSARSGSSFEPGIFGQRSALGSGPHRLLLVAQEDRLIYYINGQLVGILERQASAGGIGNAVVNFDPTLTSCQFSDTWVWAWS
jgi:hypothetical protein